MEGWSERAKEIMPNRKVGLLPKRITRSLELNLDFPCDRKPLTASQGTHWWEIGIISRGQDSDLDNPVSNVGISSCIVCTNYLLQFCVFKFQNGGCCCGLAG